MNFLNFKKEKYAIASAIFYSLLTHLTVGALLIFYLSTNVISSPKLNGINLVWISLDAKKESSGMKIRNNRFDQSSSAIKRTSEKPVKAEILAHNPEIISVSTLTTNNLSSKFELVKNETRGTVTGEKSNTITGNRTYGTAGKTSNSNAMIAYPLYKENAPPVYPEIARTRGYEGIVLLFAEILSDGRVGKIKIEKSSGYAILDQSAIRAIKPWKFEPAKRSGSPFTAWVELPIKFILNNNSQS